MLRQWFRGIYMVGGLWLGACSQAAAAQDPLEFGCDRHLHIAFYEYGSLYHQGVGIDPDVITELAKRTGCQFETEIIPRAQAWKRLHDNDLDMAPSGIATPARRQFAYFVNYMAFKDLIVAKAEIAPSIKSFDDIAGQTSWRIGIVGGFVYGPFYDFRLPNIQDQSRISTYPDQAALYQALIDGSVDLILSPPLNYSFYLPLTDQQQHFTVVDVSPAPPVPHGLVLNRARFSPSMVNAWMRVIEEMRLDGTLLQIYRRRLPPDVAQGLLTY